MTEYNIDQEPATSSVVAGTEWDVFDSATGRIKKCTATQISSFVWANASATNAITAFAGGGQTNATALTTTVNRVTTVATAGDSVRLPASVAGMEVLIINSGANTMQVYGAGTDTVNGVATATGISMPANSVDIFVCPLAGVWFAEVGVGFSGSLPTLLSKAAITAGTTRTQAGATALTADINRVDTSTAPAAGSTLGDGVVLPASATGLDIVVINNTANIVQVYGAGSDTVNGVAAATGVPIPPNCVEIFACPLAGAWFYDAGVGFSGALNTVLSVDGITAAGANQAGATALPADMNRVSTVAGGTGVALPVAKAGMDVIVLNHGANSMKVYANGSDTIDDVAGPTGVAQMVSSVVLYTCYANGAWYTNGIGTGYSGSLPTVSFTDAMVATAGGAQAGTAITTVMNRFVTVASAGDSAQLPVSSPGLQLVVINAAAANSMNVFGQTGDTIDAIAANSPRAVAANKTATFYCTVAGKWHSLLTA